MIRLSFEDQLKIYEPLICYLHDLGYTYVVDRDWNDINVRSRVYSLEVKNRFFNLTFEQKNASTLTLLARNIETGGFILKDYIKFFDVDPRYNEIAKLSHNPEGIPPSDHQRIAELTVDLLKGPLHGVITGKEWIEVPFDWGHLK